MDTTTTWRRDLIRRTWMVVAPDRRQRPKSTGSALMPVLPWKRKRNRACDPSVAK